MKFDFEVAKIAEAEGFNKNEKWMVELALRRSRASTNILNGLETRQSGSTKQKVKCGGYIGDSLSHGEIKRFHGELSRNMVKDESDSNKQVVLLMVLHMSLTQPVKEYMIEKCSKYLPEMKKSKLVLDYYNSVGERSWKITREGRNLLRVLNVMGCV